MSAKRADITQVADLAGVSVSTVSQVLGGSRPVSTRTRAKVNAAIVELRYHPNPAARSLRSQRTESIALIVSDITNPFYPLVAVGMQEVLIPAGYMLSVSDAALRSASVSQVIDHVLARRVDGIALGTYGLSERDLQKIRDAHVRVVTFGREEDLPESDCVESDDEGGFLKVTGHLTQTGRTRLAFIGGEQTPGPNTSRLAGFHRALLVAGLQSTDNVSLTGFDREGGHRGVEDLFSRSGEWDAVVCANDLIAIGAIEALRARGLRVPDDVAVTGYDDIEAAALISPTLTTVENPAREIGRTAAQLLLSRLDGSSASDVRQHIVLSNRLIIRNSSTRPVNTTK